MRKGLWVLFVFVALVMVADTASAECVTCRTTNCVNRFGSTILATACDYVSMQGEGVSNCRNVRNCGGCMGWSCYYDGEVPLRVVRPETVVIEVVPQKNAVETVSER
ncbi:MAG TPA: hypothetical protein VE010_17525 [Thermoanaerobaculia bacterium]|nr:hypothetical protein [Thermoanaerobaculia bacterium]